MKILIKIAYFFIEDGSWVSYTKFLAFAFFCFIFSAAACPGSTLMSLAYSSGDVKMLQNKLLQRTRVHNRAEVLHYTSLLYAKLLNSSKFGMKKQTFLKFRFFQNKLAN